MKCFNGLLAWVVFSTLHVELLMMLRLILCIYYELLEIYICVMNVDVMDSLKTFACK